MAEDVIQVARLRGIVEILGAAEASGALRTMQREFEQAASGSQKAATGLAALDQHAKTAYERAQEAGKRFNELETALEETAEAAGDAAEKLNQTGDAAEDSGKKASESAKSQGLFSNVLGDVSAKSVLAGLGLAGLGLKTIDLAKDAARTAIDYEQSFASVRKTIDATEAEYADLSRAIRDMATEIPVAASEIASIAAAAGQLGIEKHNIIDFTRTIADLGVATDLSGEQAAMTLARFINVTGTAQDQVGNLASGLVHLGNTTASTESQIMSMAMRLAAAGKTVGLTDGQILGMAATLSSLGLEAEAGGNNISMVLLEIDKAVDMTGEKLNILAETAGMSATDFAMAWENDPARAFQSFLQGLNRVEEQGGNVSVILDQLGFDGIRAGDAIRRTAGNTDLLAESMSSASDAIRDNNALTDEANQFYDTSANKLEIAKNKWDDLSITLAERFIPAGVEVVSTIGDMALGIANVVEHLTSSRTLEAVEIWERLTGGAQGGKIELPEMPQEEPEGIWWISNWANTDWGDVWDQFKAPDDVMNQFAELSANELFQPETREKLQAIVDAYGNLRPEMGGVTEEQRKLAEQILYYIEQAEIALEVDAERARQGLLGTEAMQQQSGAYEEQIAIIERVAQAERERAELAAAAPLIDRQTQYLVDQEEQIGKVAAAYRLSAPDIAELGRLFEGNSEMAAKSVADIVSGVANGSVAFRDAAQLYEGAIDDHVIAAIDKAREKFEEELRRAILLGTDPTEAETNLKALEALFGDVTAATDELVSAQERVNEYTKSTADALKHWEDSLGDVEDAINYLLDIEERQGYLTADQMRQYEELIWYQDRLAGGIENDMIPAYIDAQVKAAEFARVQDELNQLLADGKINEEQHAAALLDAALAADAGSIASHGLAQAQEKTAEAVTKAIQKVEDLLVRLGEIPPNVDSTVTVHIQTVGEFPAGFTEFEPTGPLAGSGLTATDTGQYNTGRDRAAEAEAAKSAANAEREAERAANEAQREAEKAAREAEREAENAAKEAARAAEETAKFQTSILSDLEKRLDPEYIRGLEEELESLFDMRDFAIENDLGEATVSKIEADIAKVEEELGLLGVVAGSEYGQGIIAGLETINIAESVGTMFSSIFDGASGGEKLQEDIANLKSMIALGLVQGLDPDVISVWMEELVGLESEAAQYWQNAAAAAAAGLLDPSLIAEFAEAGGEQFHAYLSALIGEDAASNLIDSATKLGEDALNAIRGAFTAGSSTYALGEDGKNATKFVDNLIQAVADGTIAWEDALDIMSGAARSDLLPILEELGTKYHDDWVLAILNGNQEAADSILQLLGIVNDAQDQVSPANAGGGGGPKPMDPWEFFGMPKQTWVAAGMPIPGEEWDGDPMYRQYTRDGLWQGQHGSASASTIAHAQSVKNEMLGITPEELVPEPEELVTAGDDAGTAFAEAFTDAASGIDWDAILAEATGAAEDLRHLIDPSNMSDQLRAQIAGFDTAAVTGLNLMPPTEPGQALDADTIRKAVAEGIREGIQGGGFDATFNIDVGGDRLYSIVWDIMNRIFQETV